MEVSSIEFLTAIGLHLSLVVIHAKLSISAGVKAIITYFFSFIHGPQNGHIQLFQSRQDIDVFSQMWSKVL